jgi:hypothetical protein
MATSCRFFESIDRLQREWAKNACIEGELPKEMRRLKAATEKLILEKFSKMYVQF